MLRILCEDSWPTEYAPVLVPPLALDRTQSAVQEPFPSRLLGESLERHRRESEGLRLGKLSIERFADSMAVSNHPPPRPVEPAEGSRTLTQHLGERIEPRPLANA